jgi:hypothetical protein
MIMLPRQARDKHRENSKKDAVFLQDKELPFIYMTGKAKAQHLMWFVQVRKRSF